MTNQEMCFESLRIMQDTLLQIHRELTASLAIVRGKDKPTACSLCGDETDSREIKENNGYCEYCSLQDERVERYREIRHPDQRG